VGTRWVRLHTSMHQTSSTANPAMRKGNCQWVKVGAPVRTHSDSAISSLYGTQYEPQQYRSLKHSLR
jgi:hypothetical protein